MRRFLDFGRLLAALLLLLTTVAVADVTPFDLAQRHGDNIPGPDLHWTFQWQGKDVSVYSNGKGKAAGQTFQVPLNGTRISGDLRYATYNGELLLLLEETDEESSAGKLVRFASKTWKPKWECGIPGLNVGPGVLAGKFAYVSARGTAMKVNLDSGKWDWRKTNLTRNGADGQQYRINAFALPTIHGDTVVFPELPSEGSAAGAVTLKTSDGEVVEVR